MKRMGYLAVAFLVLLTLTIAVYALNPAPYNGLNKGNGNAKHLYLYQKDPSSWQIVEDGAWGKITFSEGWFVFNGYDLEAYQSYTLIYYPDLTGNPWPHPIVIIGIGQADAYGDVHIAGYFNFKSIPWTNDLNNPGAEIWLVLSGDIVGGPLLSGWQPTTYLFEYNLIYPSQYWP